MGQSLKVRLEDSELEEIRKSAERMQMTVDEWVHWVLLESQKLHPDPSVDMKLRAVRAAAHHEFPTGNIDQLLHEIGQGYRFDPPT